MQPEELRGIRKGLAMSQADFASTLGVSRKTISEMERGKTPIDRRTAIAARRLSLTPDQIALLGRFAERRVELRREIHVLKRGDLHMFRKTPDGRIDETHVAIERARAMLADVEYYLDTFASPETLLPLAPLSQPMAEVTA